MGEAEDIIVFLPVFSISYATTGAAGQGRENSVKGINCTA
jgi:hypothetical protein